MNACIVLLVSQQTNTMLLNLFCKYLSKLTESYKNSLSKPQQCYLIFVLRVECFKSKAEWRNGQRCEKLKSQFITNYRKQILMILFITSQSTKKHNQAIFKTSLVTSYVTNSLKNPLTQNFLGDFDKTFFFLFHSDFYSKFTSHISKPILF